MEWNFTSKTRKIGDSIYIEVPKLIADALSLRGEDFVSVSIKYFQNALSSTLRIKGERVFSGENIKAKLKEYFDGLFKEIKEKYAPAFITGEIIAFSSGVRFSLSITRTKDNINSVLEDLIKFAETINSKELSVSFNLMLHDPAFRG